MCGNVGCAGTLNMPIETAFKQLLILDSLRGEDSTGIAFIHRDDEVTLAKEVGDPYYVLNSRKAINGFKRANAVIIGHNRFATTGKVNRANSHPFEVGEIIGAHNGTLKNRFSLPDAKDFDTDSECLYAWIEKDGVAKAIGGIEGAWALVWYDKRNESINFLRNAERPLFIATSKDKKTIFWASEKWMLSVVAQRNNLQMDIAELSVDSHLCYEIPASHKEFNLPTITSVKGKEVAVVKNNMASVSYFQGLVTTVGNGESVTLTGKQIAKNAEGAWFASMRSTDAKDFSEYRVYGKTEEALKQYLIGTWKGHVSYIVRSNGFLVYNKISPDTITLLDDGENDEKVLVTKTEFDALPSHTCCNCHQKVTWAEDFRLVEKKFLLCADCNYPMVIDLVKEYA